MEKFPSSAANSSEKKPEVILTSEQILEALSQHAEGFTLSRELSDEKGVYLREIEVVGENEGEVIEYQYMRKGVHPNNNVSDVTTISRIYYQDGVPVGGDKVATFNEETGEWKTL
jgi:hypothetical protein